MSMQYIINMMNNPMIKSMMNSKNPKEMAISIIKNSPNANSEIAKNVIGLIENGDEKRIEEYGRNLIKSQGGNPDEVKEMINKVMMNR